MSNNLHMQIDFFLKVAIIFSYVCYINILVAVRNYKNVRLHIFWLCLDEWKIVWKDNTEYTERKVLLKYFDYSIWNNSKLFLKWNLLLGSSFLSIKTLTEYIIQK